MHSKAMIALLLSLAACPAYTVLVPQPHFPSISSTVSSPLETSGSALVSRDFAKVNASLAWCRNDQAGIPLWLADGNVDSKDTSRHGTVRINDVRDYLIAGKDAGGKEIGLIIQARLAAMAAWARLAEVEVQQAFAGGTDKAAAWCLSGKEKFTLAAPAGHQKKDGWDAYIKEGDDLKKSIETAKVLAGDPGLAAWPWFINQACRPGDLNSVASDNTLAQGESQAVSFLSTLTGEDCEITGGYEENNEDVNRILAKSKDTPVVVLLPDDPSINEYRRGIWPVMEYKQSADVQPSGIIEGQAGATDAIMLWNYTAGRTSVANLPVKMKVVHIKGAGGEPNGHWDKYKDGKGKFP